MLNTWCGTCPAFFNQIETPEIADLDVVHDQLNTGLDGIDDEVLRLYSQRLPASTYTVLLLEFTARLVMPGSDLDYFSTEQIVTWGEDLDPPDYKVTTPYYRTFEAPAASNRHLYEVVVPMVPPTWNDRSRVEHYEANDGLPTVVAYSVVDVLQPAMDYGDDYYEHVVLTHFLLDGHHKLEAAAATQRPIRMLALIDEHASLATAADLVSTVEARAGVRQAR